MRNTPLKAFAKKSPLRQDNNPGGHELRELTEEESRAFKEGKHGSAPNPAKSAYQIAKVVRNIGKKVIKKLKA